MEIEYKYFTDEELEFINSAMYLIKQGISQRLDKGRIKVYSCGSNVIRIDVKDNVKNVI